MLQQNGQTLAYIGDAVYELYVRECLVKMGLTQVKKLHQKAIDYTSAQGQANALDRITELLTEEEHAIINRGRNASVSRKPRSVDLMTYKYATGFEALIGYLHLDKKYERIETLLKEALLF